MRNPHDHDPSISLTLTPAPGRQHANTNYRAIDESRNPSSWSPWVRHFAMRRCPLPGRKQDSILNGEALGIDDKTLPAGRLRGSGRAWAGGPMPSLQLGAETARKMRQKTGTRTTRTGWCGSISPASSVTLYGQIRCEQKRKRGGAMLNLGIHASTSDDT